MDEQQFRHLEQSVKDTVHVTVNRKIDALSFKLEQYVKDDDAWKQRAEPLVRAYESTSWLVQSLLAILKFLGLLAVGIGAWATVRQFFLK